MFRMETPRLDLRLLRHPCFVVHAIAEKRNSVTLPGNSVMNGGWAEAYLCKRMRWVVALLAYLECTHRSRVITAIPLRTAEIGACGVVGLWRVRSSNQFAWSGVEF